MSYQRGDIHQCTYIDKDLDFQKKANIDVGVGSAVEGVCVNEGPNPRDVVPTDSLMKRGM